MHGIAEEEGSANCVITPQMIPFSNKMKQSWTTKHNYQQTSTKGEYITNGKKKTLEYRVQFGTNSQSSMLIMDNKLVS